MPGTVFSSDASHSGAYVVYMNGIEVPTKSVSTREGVWQMPEASIEMVADPVLTRLGAEDRVQVSIFELDDVRVDPSVSAAFRLFFEGEITGWGYRNTRGGRSIVFTAVSQMAIFTQLFVQFLTTFDDLLGYASNPASGIAGEGVPSSEIVFPFSLFKQGLIPQGQTDATTGQPLQQDPSSITRPFDFLYNVIRNMIGAQVPPAQQTVPAANFFSRWTRLTNFQNRFMASPFFDEVVDNANVFPVLRALQNVSAVDVIAKSLLPQVQNAGSIWDMLQLVYQTVLMEIAMISAMPLVSVDLASGLVVETDMSQHKLVLQDGRYVSSAPADAHPTQPSRIPNYFPKPQLLFGIPPSCNVFFPSQVKMLAYDENYATQPTRMYFNDETVTRLLNIQGNARDTVMNALTTAYPPEADAANLQHKLFPKFNGKNFLLFPEEFFKGPVMDRRDVPPWLFFLRQGELAAGAAGAPTGDGSTPEPPAPAQTGAASTTKIQTPPPAGTMATGANVGAVDPSGHRVFDRAVERLRSKVDRLGLASGIPTDFLLAWVQEESDGDIASVTRLNERGYFQIMGPHVEKDGTVVNLKDTEAAQIGLGLADTGQGPDTPGARLSVDEDFSLQSGVQLVQFYRRLANTNRATFSLAWTEGDMWRLTKLEHNASGEAHALLQRAQVSLGRPPASWDEMYATVLPTASGLDKAILNNAAGVGGVVAGATGRMTTKGDATAIKSPTPAPAPAAPVDASASPSAPQSTTSPSGVVPTDLYDQVREGNETVYQLYAKYEYFRERYARRTGSVHLAWNRYAVPGFPCAIFDQRATRVDLLCYITTIQRTMSNAGEKSTVASFVYGRTFQEMFDLLAQDFSEGGAAAGSSPREPIRDIRKVAQNFGQAEEYYQRVFYGGNRLFGKDASCDWRKLVGYAPITPNGAPTPIFIDGPDEAAQDDATSAQAAIAATVPLRDQIVAQILSLEAQQQATLLTVAKLSPSPTLSTVDKATLDGANATLTALLAQIDALTAQLALANSKIDKALSILQAPPSTAAEVTHNLSALRELVPLPSAAALFESYDAAMRYNWRPICTLDEYVIFYDSAGEGTRSAGGARYFDRIRRLAPLTASTVLPPAADGLDVPQTVTAPQSAAQEGAADPQTGQPAQAAPTQTSVPGLGPGFPQTRADWDAILLAYRNNVYNVKAPRG